MIELQMTIGNNATISFKSHLCKYKTAPYQQWSRAFKLNPLLFHYLKES